MDSHGEGLARAIDALAGRFLAHMEEIEEGRRACPSLMRDLSAAHGLLRTLAHAVRGHALERAFGAPGDWGYGTPLGDGLREWQEAKRKEP